MMIRTSIKSALAATMLYCMVSNAVAVESSELIRASIIEKVSRFIEWPSSNYEHFTICVTDKTPLLPAMQTYYANMSLADKPVNLSIIHDIKKLTECQVIFLDEDQSDNLNLILLQASKLPILIVTGKQDDVSQGAHVDFYVQETRLRLEVNKTALMNSGLKASYHLLQVARIVE
ncbi:MAG: YfiR family protein [Methylobacter sp.]